MKSLFRTDPRLFFFFSSRRRHTRCRSDWSSDVCSSDLDEMSEAVEIRRFNTQYRLRPSQFEVRHRLDRLIPQLTGGAMELALERAGIRFNEIVCIRSVYVPVRLRFSRPDSALVAEWANRLAEAVASAAADARVAVRYGSRSLALVDMGAHISQ